MSSIYGRSEPPGTRLADPPAPAGDVVLATFGGGAPHFRRQADALAAEARATGWFSEVLALSDLSTDPVIEALHAELGPFLAAHPRGLGYWVWKPFILARLFDRFPDAPFFLYADAGCEFSRLGGDRFAEYLGHAQAHDALFLQLPFPERDWAKAELRDLPQFAGIDMDSGQYQATWLLFRNSPRARALVDEWLRLATLDHGSLIADPTAREPGLKSHRHDQAILSLLAKSRGFPAIPWEDVYIPDLYVPNSWTLLFPIHARRARRRRLVARLASLSSAEACRRNLIHPGPAFRFARGIGRLSRAAMETMRWIRDRVQKPKEIAR